MSLKKVFIARKQKCNLVSLCQSAPRWCPQAKTVRRPFWSRQRLPERPGRPDEIARRRPWSSSRLSEVGWLESGSKKTSGKMSTRFSERIGRRPRPWKCTGWRETFWPFANRDRTSRDWRGFAEFLSLHWWLFLLLLLNPANILSDDMYRLMQSTSVIFFVCTCIFFIVLGKLFRRRQLLTKQTQF